MHKLLEYYVTDESVLVFVVGRSLPSHLGVERVPCAYRVLSDLVKRYRAALTAGQAAEDLAAELYALLLEPLFRRGWVVPGERLGVAPHRCLRYLPFQALGDGRRLLLETNAVAYLPVASALADFSAPPEKLQGGLVVHHSAAADPPLLRESFRREARRVAALTRGPLLGDADAHPAAIEQAVAGRRLLHFTCHGTFRETDPEGSGLLLADREGRDTLLSLDTIGRMRLEVDLVVLAACETGLSDRHPGDELVGLVRAFMKAGARAVLATLWPVHSLSTELFVTRFYHHLLSHGEFSEAARQAQLELRDADQAGVAGDLQAERARRGAALAGPEEELLALRLADIGFAPTPADAPRAGVTRDVTAAAARDPSSTHPFRHPYFWSPFVLLGAGHD